MDLKHDIRCSWNGGVDFQKTELTERTKMPALYQISIRYNRANSQITNKFQKDKTVKKARSYENENKRQQGRRVEIR